LGEALAISGRDAEAEGQRLRQLCDDFVAALFQRVSGVAYNGHPTERIPGNVSLSIDGIEPLALMHRLNGFASFSASSACATDKVKTSDVLIAMFGDGSRARQAFRVSPGRGTDARDMASFLEELIRAVEDLRRFAA
jgi:cysteine desulfurase